MQHHVDFPFLPESLKDEGGADFLRLGMDVVALPLQNHKRTLGEPGKGTNEAFNISLALQLINAAYCSNNPLDALFVLPVVFYDLEVFIPPCLLDSRKHGAPSLTPIIYRS